MSVDRVENWRNFSRHIEKYISSRTVEKYTVEGSEGCDLMSMTNDWRICIWNILRYATRLWNGHAKDHDLEKIAHYSEIAWAIEQENQTRKEKEIDS